MFVQMVEEARSSEEDALNLLPEELKAKAAENKSLQVFVVAYCVVKAGTGSWISSFRKI